MVVISGENFQSQFALLTFSLEDWYLNSYGSPIAMILFFIAFFLGISALGACILLLMRRKKDVFSIQYHNFYKKAESLVRGFFFTGQHKADFFGRVSILSSLAGPYVSCLIPPPEVVDEAVLKRFVSFKKAIEGNERLAFTSYAWTHDDKLPLILVCDRLISPTGNYYPTLSDYLSNKKLGRKDKENILLTLARTLSVLHQIKTESGEKLYHGFLLPRSLFLATYPHHSIKKFVLSDSGLAFAVGPEKIYQRIEALKKGKLPIESSCSQELLNHLPMLAPEQKDRSRLHEVCSTSDFFTFASVAVTLFTGRRFTKPSDVDWLQVPEKWRAFLFACLEDKLVNRPHEFLEIEEWLTDPELSLSFYQTSLKSEEMGPRETRSNEEVNLASLTLLLNCLDKAHSNPQFSSNLSEDLKKKIIQSLHEGHQAMSTAQWAEAKKCFNLVLRIDPKNRHAHTNLAIIYYELNDLKAAEEHYELAKKENLSS
jgi:tetratricopeptide (TPR) repeat protein